MHRLSRMTALRIAAIIVFALALFDMFAWQIPGLIEGAEAVNELSQAGDGASFFFVLAGFATSVLAIIAAYGAWQGQRWGSVLVILISAWHVFTGTLAAVESDFPTNVIAIVGLLLSLVAIILCLWRDAEAAPRSA